jgi:hypothetical protein
MKTLNLLFTFSLLARCYAMIQQRLLMVQWTVNAAPESSYSGHCDYHLAFLQPQPVVKSSPLSYNCTGDKRDKFNSAPAPERRWTLGLPVLGNLKRDINMSPRSQSPPTNTLQPIVLSPLPPLAHIMYYLPPPLQPPHAHITYYYPPTP